MIILISEQAVERRTTVAAPWVSNHQPLQPRRSLVQMRVTLTGLFAAFAAGCISPRVLRPQAGAAGRVDVQLDAGEAVAALAILRERAAGRRPTSAEWQRVLESRGYTHLVERETSMHRVLNDSTFTAFLQSDTLLARYPQLAPTLPALEHLDVTAAANRALAYLPAGTPLRARLYLEIKPATNSFVFTGRDSIPSIFLYVDPGKSAAQLENTIAHELHHIGLNAACREQPFIHATPAQRMLLRFLGGFGEGQAMLAAAGSPAIHPHAADDDTIRQRWDRDVAHAHADIDDLSAFFASVLDGRIASADSVRERAMTYYGVQGPWYTVGWLMASTIERELGRPALVATLCDPAGLMILYNRAAERAQRHGAAAPTWPPALLARLEALASAG
jgi:hypothetical protein